MLLRRKDRGLPMASHPGAPDGSGRGILMEAPVHRFWRQASGYIKGSYIMLAVSVGFIFLGYQHLRYNNASLHLTCHAQECSIVIYPPGWHRKVKVSFPRPQLLGAQSTKVDPSGTFLKLDNGPPFPKPTKNKRKKGKKGNIFKGPDEDGNYWSYQVELSPPSNGTAPTTDDDEVETSIPESDFSELRRQGVARVDEDTGHIFVSMRPFNFAVSRRRPRSMVTRVESYVKRRRHKLSIREHRGLSWQGILFIVLGLFSLLLTVLLGQFREEETVRQGGPGARREFKGRQSQQKSASRPMQSRYGTTAMKAPSGAVRRKQY